MSELYPDRKVWPYEACGEKLFADPLVVWHRFMEAVGGDANLLVERAYPQVALHPPSDLPPPTVSDSVIDTMSAGARIEIGRAMINALELEPFDRKTGKGVTTSQGEELYLQWLAWMEDKKKDSAGSPTLSTPVPATGSPAPWATPTPSASG